MSRFSAIAITLFAIACFWPVVDNLLPAEETDTHVHHFLEGKVAYMAPGTGGGMETCSVTLDASRQLQQGDEIVVTRTPVFGRCTGIKPMRCWGLVCSADHDDTVDADQLLREAIRFTYRNTYSNAGELADDHPGYSPEIRRWPAVRGGPWSLRRYSVRLPGQLVIFGEDGALQTSRTCGHTGGLCRKIPLKPRDEQAHPALRRVGLDPPQMDPKPPLTSSNFSNTSTTGV